MRNHFLFVLLVLIGNSIVGAQGTTAFPSQEDFENEIQCPQNSCGPVCPLLGKWENDTSDDLDWGSDVDGTPSPDTGPAVDHTLNNSSGHYLYIESSCSATGFPTKTARLLSPVFDFTSLTNPELEFWYHMRGNSMGTMHVDLSTDGGSNWTNDIVPSWTGNQNAWMHKDISLIAYAGQSNIRLRIRGITGTNFNSDMAIDDILVYQAVGRDLQLETVLSPHSGCTLGTMERVKVVLKNFGQDTLSGDSIQVTAKRVGGATLSESFPVLSPVFPGDTLHFTFSGSLDLSQSGPHQIEVNAALSGDVMTGNDSLVHRLYNFQRISSLPYSQDFESGMAGWYTGGERSSWAYGIPAKPIINSAASGTKCWVTGGLFNGRYNAMEASWLQGPCVDFSGACNPWIELKIWIEAENSFDGASVQYSLDGGAVWTTVGDATTGINWYNDNFINAAPGGDQKGWTGDLGAGSGGWMRARHDLSSLAGMSDVLLRIAFGSDENTERDGIAIDDIALYDGAWLRTDTATCAPDTILLESGAQAGNYSYLWSTGDTSSSIMVSQSGQYWLEITHGSCITRDTVNLEFSDPILPSFTVDDSACPVLGFTDNSGGGAANSWLWDFGTGNFSALQNPVVNYAPSGNGFYTVTMTATNACGSVNAMQQILIGCVTSNLEPEPQGGLTAYPNPTSDFLKVAWDASLENEPLRMFSSDGKEVWPPESPDGQAIVLDVRALPVGIYFVRMGSATKVVSIRR